MTFYFPRPPMVGDLLAALQPQGQLFQLPQGMKLAPQQQQPQQLMQLAPPQQVYMQQQQPPPPQYVQDLRVVPQANQWGQYAPPQGQVFVNPSQAPQGWPPGGLLTTPQPSVAINEPLALSPVVLAAGATVTLSTVVNKPAQLARMVNSVVESAACKYESVEIVSLTIGGKNAFNGGGRVPASAFRLVDSFSQGPGLYVMPGQSIEVTVTNTSADPTRYGVTFFGPTGE